MNNENMGTGRATSHTVACERLEERGGMALGSIPNVDDRLMGEATIALVYLCNETCVFCPCVPPDPIFPTDNMWAFNTGQAD